MAESPHFWHMTESNTSVPFGLRGQLATSLHDNKRVYVYSPLFLKAPVPSRVTALCASAVHSAPM